MYWRSFLWKGMSKTIITAHYKFVTGEGVNNLNTITFFLHANNATILQLQKDKLSGNFSVNLSAVYQMA